MKFYNREQELASLRQIDNQTETNSAMTVIVGRRRTGKTTLIGKAFENKEYLYFFVGNSTEQILCEEWQKRTEETLQIQIHGQISRVKDLLEIIFRKAQERQVTLVIDEFQRFDLINESIISDIQDVWDRYHTTAKIHFIACGSIWSMMKKIFENEHEPLFRRYTHKMVIRPFKPSVLKTILKDYNPQYTNEDLLALYAITGGVAKYVALFMDMGACTKSLMFDAVCSPTSLFFSEGTELLIGEFGRRYSVYFSIMQLIAGGMTAQSEIDGILQKKTGRYMETLADDYSLISKNRPMFSKPNAQGIKWSIDDNFLRFWFRFIENNRSMIELDKYDLLREYLDKHYDLFSGFALERYFRELAGEQPRTTQVGNWWDNKGENEIDLIALEELDKRALIAEVKRNPRKYSGTVLREKAKHVLPYLKGYDIEYRGYSIEDM